MDEEAEESLRALIIPEELFRSRGTSEGTEAGSVPGGDIPGSSSAVRFR